MSVSRTLAGAAEHVAEIRKSRFLAQAEPVTDVAAALAFVSRVADASANHNCWAYRIGQDYRFNDDGEPGGTAGKPILQAIDGQGLDGVAVVVTRWFGGIKLGAGGLARAYGGTAAECLRQAPQREVVPMQRMRVTLGYAEVERLRARRDEFAAEFEHEQFGADGVVVVLQLPQARLPALARLLADLSRGACVPQLLD